MLVRLSERSELTLAMLKTLLEYDSIKGVFTWKVKRRNQMSIGDVAGAVAGRYQVIRIDGVDFYAHKLAWLYVYGVYPKKVDHKNRNSLDNRISNLRESTQRENCQNRSKAINCSSGYKGVTKRKSRWIAQIQIDGRKVHLGMYNTKEDAARAYNEASQRYFGEFAVFNDVPSLF